MHYCIEHIFVAYYALSSFTYFPSFSVSEVPYSNIQDYKIVLNVLQLACVILLFVEKAGFCI